MICLLCGRPIKSEEPVAIKSIELSIPVSGREQGSLTFLGAGNTHIECAATLLQNYSTAMRNAAEIRELDRIARGDRGAP